MVLGGLPGRHPHARDLRQAAQRQLGLSRYETAWLMLQKLRRAMVAPERTPLVARSRSMRAWSAAID